jgi:hypothetical protein
MTLAADRARLEGEQLEQLMRAILRLFADGRLAYRRRELRARPVSAAALKVRALRIRALAERSRRVREELARG